MPSESITAAARAQDPSKLITAHGEMADRIRNHPWSDSPLGPIASWSSTLLAHVNLVLNCPAALALYWGPEMVFVCNDASVRGIGSGLTEALGLPAHELWGSEWPRMQTQFHSVLSSGESFSSENHPVRFPRNGRTDEAFVDYSLSPVYENGKVAGIFRTLHETTDNVTAMRALAESNERLRMALSVGTGFGVWDWHIQTGLVYADETIAKLYDLDPAAAAAGVSHLLFERMLHPDDIAILTDAIMDSILTGREYSVEYRVRRVDGSYGWVQSMGRCLYDEQGHAYRVFGLKTDVTDRKEREIASSILAPATPFAEEKLNLLPPPIRSFLVAAVYGLAEVPEEITMDVIPGPETTRVVVRAAVSDLGKLIGKQGRTMRSVRTLLIAVSGRFKHRFSIDVEVGGKSADRR